MLTSSWRIAVVCAPLWASCSSLTLSFLLGGQVAVVSDGGVGEVEEDDDNIDGRMQIDCIVTGEFPMV